MKAKYILAVLLLSFCFLGSFAEEFEGKCVGVSDGDTITVMKDGRAVKVRLDGVDCPEGHQAFGSRAKQFVASKTFRKILTVRVKTRDRYNRIVGRVYIEKEDLTDEIIKSGMGWHYKKYNGERKLAESENRARALKVGLWRDSNPTPPWDFRRGKTNSKNLNSSSSSSVYLTRTGKCYHLGHCSSLSRSKIPTSLSDAQNKGLRACRRCNPPSSISSSSSSSSYKSKRSSSSSSYKSSYSSRCMATTKKGRRCKRKAKAGSSYCWQHK